jgi:hypothetical protein
MAICPHCGVELGDDAETCPLCRMPLPEGRNGSAGASYPEKAQDPEDFDGFSPTEKRKVFLEVFSVCSLIAASVVSAVDLISGRPLALSWSLFPVITIALTWLAVCVPIVLFRRPWLIFAALAPALLLYAFLIDVLDGGGLSWFPTIGGPIIAVAEGLVIATVVLAVLTKRKGLNVIAMALTAGAVFVTSIEIILNLNLSGRVFVTWSAVVDTTAVPVAGFLFYLHYRITKRASLRKLFHV